ncbi:MAG TPA: LLM class flavin-dependent oxidoreductase [Pseudonocardia sp.]|nr:LLM class flavin-dependent oxidoreductase [Pseudonocardia sp.]
MVALGVPRLTSGARIRPLEETIVLVRALCGGGDPVTFDGEFYQVTDLAPTAEPAPPIWVGAGGAQGARGDRTQRGRLDSAARLRLAQHRGCPGTPDHRGSGGLRRARPGRCRSRVPRGRAYHRGTGAVVRDP